MPWTDADLPDLSGHTAIVTGANAGLGFPTAKALAAHGAHVVLACRNTTSAQAAAARIEGSTEVRPLDLASLASVRAFAADWSGPLHLLVNNAGVIGPREFASTSDGFELNFGTNHLGHFLLTGALLPALLATPGGARVTTVASSAHRSGHPDVVYGNDRAHFRGVGAYGNSKLANLLFALQLHREATQRGLPLVSTAAHPGTAATELFTAPEGLGSSRILKAVLGLLIPLTAQSPEQGALPTLYAATRAEPGSYSGPQGSKGRRGPVGPAMVSETASDEQLARDLWGVSEELTEFTYPWPAD